LTIIDCQFLTAQGRLAKSHPTTKGSIRRRNRIRCNFVCFSYERIGPLPLRIFRVFQPFNQQPRSFDCQQLSLLPRHSFGSEEWNDFTTFITAVEIRRWIGIILSGTVALLVHCSWVLLNGSSVIYRLWTVLGKPYPSLLCVESVARRLTRVPLLFQQLYVQSVPSSHSYGLSYSNKQSIFQ